MTLPLTWARKIDWRIIFLAAAITIAQVTFATLSARGHAWQDRYLSLWTWDGAWYADIAEFGYRSTDPPVTTDHTSNVAFFPAYPLLARAVWKLTGCSVPLALLLTAQGAALVFWWALLRQLRDWRIVSSVSVAVVMFTICHPSSFYMVVTYADSLFMASFLLLLVWGGRAGNSVLCTFAAAAAGYICSAARIVGAPLAALPVVWAWNDLWPSIKAHMPFGALLLKSWRYALVSAATAFGTIGFFVYCAVRFGHWDLYMRTRATGWQIFKTDYSAILALSNFDVSLPRFENDFVSPVHLSHTYLAAMVVALVVIPALDYWLCRRKPLAKFSERVPLYLAAWLIFFFSASGGGLREGHYLGFLRYGFYSQLPLILGVAHAREHLRPGQEISFFWRLLIFLACALGLAIQAQFCRLYAHAIMVS